MAKGECNVLGKKFGRLTVVEALDGRKARCICDCGKETIAFRTNLNKGHTRSCGCLKDELRSEINRTHGYAKDYPKLYNSWGNMIGRCTRPNNKYYPYYGGRGITVCERWLDAGNFCEDMLPTWEPGLTLDRIDTNGNYEPGNVRWATRKVQQNNRRTNRIIETPKGKMTVAQAAEAFGMTYKCLSNRIHRGWPMERIFPNG